MVGKRADLICSPWAVVGLERIYGDDFEVGNGADLLIIKQFSLKLLVKIIEAAVQTVAGPLGNRHPPLPYSSLVTSGSFQLEGTSK